MALFGPAGSAYDFMPEPERFSVDLHWMPHAHGSVEIAKLCKKYHPDTPVVFGGFTASFFHEELIRYDCVDYVLRGDSTEEPFARLLWTLKRNGSVADVPNLTYKDACLLWNPSWGLLAQQPHSCSPDHWWIRC